MEKKEKLHFSDNTVIIGSSGFIGTELTEIARSQSENLEIPTLEEVDILDPEKISAFFDSHKVSICINLAAHTNLEEAERQREDTNALAWQLNVVGVQNLLQATKGRGIFLIQFSTDAVFPGNDSVPGPYAENFVPADDLSPLSWYGYTKLKGEELIRSEEFAALVRISYPFGKPDSPRDFGARTLSYIKKGYALFNDQEFTPTYIPDIYKILRTLSQLKEPGVYHIACSNLTTPYKFGQLLAEKLGITESVKSSSVREYMKSPQTVRRLIRVGLETKLTQQQLQITFATWQENLDEYVRLHKEKLNSLFESS